MGLKFSIDNGETWQDVPNGIRVSMDDQLIPGEDSTGELTFNFTDEGLICDVWLDDDGGSGSENPGTSSETYGEIIERLIEDNS